MTTSPSSPQVDDLREIMALSFPSNAGNWRVFTLGRDGVTRIVPYPDKGQVWFAIWRGEGLWQRITGVAGIEYTVPADAESTDPAAQEVEG